MAEQNGGDDGFAAADEQSLTQVRVRGGLLRARQAGTWTVGVSNWPATQQVAGMVGVSNWPATQQVSGTVGVSNWPATQQVSGTVGVSNWPATQQVSGTVSAVQSGDWEVAVANLPAIQQVSGTVGVSNWPATQQVSGTVNAVQSGAWSIESTQPIPLRGEQAIVPVSNAYMELPVDAVITDLLVYVDSVTGTCTLRIEEVGYVPGECPDWFPLCTEPPPPPGMEMPMVDGLNQIHMTTGIAPNPGEAWTLATYDCTWVHILWTGYQG